jgi:carboxypeptidase C (cathepsin A)
VVSFFACCHELTVVCCACVSLLLPVACHRGPGCSSVGLNFLKGSGPYIPVSNSTLLLSNPNSFTRFANVLWLEQPVFTGFSTSKDEADRTTGVCK